MTITAAGLILLIALLTLAALAVPLARWLGLPVTVLFAAVGLAHGFVLTIFHIQPFGGVLDSYDMWFVQQLALDSQSMLYLFLPPLLFDMAIVINVRRLLDDVALVIVMAVVAVAMATASVGLLVWLLSPMGLVACLMLGAAVATTDPGAVISTFREIGAPRRLLVLLEGESLLNDAAAIAIFTLLIGLLRHEVELSAAALLIDFLYAFGAGALVGLAVAACAGMIYPLLVRSTVAEASITVVVAYGAFIAAELVVGGSGVVAVVFAGLVTGSAGFLRMGPGNWATVRVLWTHVGFWANALIMILATSLVPGLMAELDWRIALLVIPIYLGAALARAAVLFGLVPLLAKLRLAAPIQTRQSILVLWGGVRGSVTLVLAVSIASMSALGEDAKILAALAAAYTLATIFLNAGTLAWLTQRLGLNRLSASDLALREKIIAGSLQRVRKLVGNIARAREIEAEALAAVEAALGQETDRHASQSAGDHIPFGERLRIGLTIVAAQEIRMVRRAFEEGAIGPRAAALMRLNAERISDAARTGGREAYEIEAQKALTPTDAYRVGLWLHRVFRVDRPLRKAIELHFASLLESERIVRELRKFLDDTVAPMIGKDAAKNVSALLSDRHKAIDSEIEAIAAQYPAYASQLETTLVMRALIRTEFRQFARLHNDGIIERELYEDLFAELNRREREAAKPPRLDLTLTPLTLMDRVSMFSGLDQAQRRRLARALRTRFTTPGEVILSAGERSTDVYFIASGAVELRSGAKSTMLGSGAFFGEIALTNPYRRRRSDVISRGHCRLLVLNRRNLARLSERDPSIEALIRKATASSPAGVT